MNTLLIFFAFPISVIIISIILEKLLKSPIAVASLTFAIFLVITFAAFDETFLIATLAYTIISFVTALIVNLLTRQRRRENSIQDLLTEILNNTENSNNNGENNEESENEDTNDNCNTVEDLLSANTANNSKERYYRYTGYTRNRKM